MTNTQTYALVQKLQFPNVNFLPEIGLYNGAIGDVIEIVHNYRPVGPNDK
jgi:hypothetical protein